MSETPKIIEQAQKDALAIQKINTIFSDNGLHQDSAVWVSIGKQINKQIEFLFQALKMCSDAQKYPYKAVSLTFQTQAQKTAQLLELEKMLNQNQAAQNSFFSLSKTREFFFAKEQFSSQKEMEKLYKQFQINPVPEQFYNFSNFATELETEVHQLLYYKMPARSLLAALDTSNTGNLNVWDELLHKLALNTFSEYMHFFKQQNAELNTILPTSIDDLESNKTYKTVAGRFLFTNIAGLLRTLNKLKTTPSLAPLKAQLINDCQDIYARMFSPIKDLKQCCALMSGLDTTDLASIEKLINQNNALIKNVAKQIENVGSNYPSEVSDAKEKLYAVIKKIIKHSMSNSWCIYSSNILPKNELKQFLISYYTKNTDTFLSNIDSKWFQELELQTPEVKQWFIRDVIYSCALKALKQKLKVSNPIQGIKKYLHENTPSVQCAAAIEIFNYFGGLGDKNKLAADFIKNNWTQFCQCIDADSVKSPNPTINNLNSEQEFKHSLLNLLEGLVKKQKPCAAKTSAEIVIQKVKLETMLDKSEKINNKKNNPVKI